MYIYFTPDLARASAFDEPRLAKTTERHQLQLAAPDLHTATDPSREWSAAAGVVMALTSGLPSQRHLAIAADALRDGRRAWFYWPAETAVECVYDERIDSWRRHLRVARWLERVAVPLHRARLIRERAPGGLRWIYRGAFPIRRSDVASHLDRLIARAQPNPLPLNARTDRPWRSAVCLCLTGAQPRLDRFASVVDEVVCVGPQAVEERERFGVRQVWVEPSSDSGQDAIVDASARELPVVKAACEATSADFLYEPLSLGRWVGAEVSQRLGLAYVIEYDGTDVLHRSALGDAAAAYTELYERAEDLALRQATVVIVPSELLRDRVVSRGVDARRVIVARDGCPIGAQLLATAAADPANAPIDRAETGDIYKDRVQQQWNVNPVGSHYARRSQPHTLEWFLEVERHRYAVYAPWMPEVMEFAQHGGRDVLEIGGGIGTDLAQFARHGARVTDVDLSAGHLQLAQDNFRARGLEGRFVHHDAETLPFDASSFDVVYSNGVLHHTPNTGAVVSEIYRVLRPRGLAIVMLYAEDSLHYWRKLVWELGVRDRLVEQWSMGEIMSRTVERSANEARPLVKVYTRRRAAALFRGFAPIEVVQRQMERGELPRAFQWAHASFERRLGWNLIIKARRPA